MDTELDENDWDGLIGNFKDFVKQISYNELSKKGLKKLSKSGYVLSKMEKLKGHSLSIKTKALRSK